MAGLLDVFRGSPRLQRRWKAELPDHAIRVCWSPDGKLLAAAAVSGPVLVLDAATGKTAATLEGHGFGTASVAWKPDGTLLASAGQDGKARIWDAATWQEKASVAGGAAWVEHVLWHPTKDVLVTAAGKKLRLWSPDGTSLRQYGDHPATISDIAWRPRSGELTSASYGGVWLW